MAKNSPSGSNEPNTDVGFKSVFESRRGRDPREEMEAERGDPARLAFMEMLGTLSRTDRLVLMLRYAEELTVAEIAWVIKQPQTRVRESLKRLQTAGRAIVNSREDGRGVAVSV